MFIFSVLRLLVTTAMSWGLLATAIGLLWHWNHIRTAGTISVTPPRLDRQSESPIEATPAEDPGSSPEARVAPANEERPPSPQPERPARSPYLWGGLACLLLSVGGGWPIRLVLGSGATTAGGEEPPPAVRTQQITRPDGSQLSVEHVGPTESPVTLLFTHGWSLDHTEWNDTRVALAGQYHLVFWDLAGLGRSTAPSNGDHSLEKMAHDLEAVLSSATSGRVVLIGHSIGGMILQTFSRLYPQHLGSRVLGLALVHTTYINPVHTVIGNRVMAALQKPLLEPLTYLTIALSPLFWLSNWQSYFNGSLHIASRLSSFAGRQTWYHIDHSSLLAAKASPAVVGRGNLAMTKFDARDVLPRINVPTLVVCGQEDRLTKPEASQFLAETIPHAERLILEPAGHLGHREQHMAFNAGLRRFVDRVAGR